MNNEIQSRIAQLVEAGWTLAAIADELGVKPDTVENWRPGRRNPTNAKAILAMLEKVLKIKRIPKQRRYAKGSRQMTKFKITYQCPNPNCGYQDTADIEARSEAAAWKTRWTPCPADELSGDMSPTTVKEINRK